MKSAVMLKHFLMSIAILVSSMSFAQDFNSPQYAKYGSTPEEREKNLRSYTLFNSAEKIKNYGEATIYLKELMTNLPNVSPNLYIKGAVIYKNLIAQSKDDAKTQIYLDSLMLIHEKRMEVYGDDPKRGKNYILGEIVKDYLRFYGDKHEVVINQMNKAIQESGGQLDGDLISTYFSFITDKYKNDALDTDTYMTEYENLMAIIEKLESENKADIKSQVESLLAQSGAISSCESIEKFYKPKFDANPNDKEVLAKIARLLQKAECKDDFQTMVAEKYYELDPSPMAAAAIAMSYESRGDIDKALEFYKNAIEQETDANNKASIILSAAGVALINNKISLASDYARQAIALNPNEGMAYFFLAQAQAQSIASSCSGFDKNAAFLIVVDNLNKARSLVDKNHVDKIDSAISTYSKYFPSAEEVFFKDLKPGDSYTIKCGIVSGTTTIRERK